MEEQLIDEILDGTIDFETVSYKLLVCDFRKKLYRRLHTELSQKQHSALVRYLFAIEVKERNLCTYDAVVEEKEIDATYDCPCSIKCCTYLLYRLGDLNDVKSIWESKTIDFDSYFELDGQLLAGAGVNETIAFFKNKRGKIARAIRKDIIRYKRQGAFDDVAYSRWRSSMNSYIGHI